MMNEIDNMICSSPKKQDVLLRIVKSEDPDRFFEAEQFLCDTKLS
jgi:hypothetical protein